MSFFLFEVFAMLSGENTHTVLGGLGVSPKVTAGWPQTSCFCQPQAPRV